MFLFTECCFYFVSSNRTEGKFNTYELMKYNLCLLADGYLGCKVHRIIIHLVEILPL